MQKIARNPLTGYQIKPNMCNVLVPIAVDSATKFKSLFCKHVAMCYKMRAKKGVALDCHEHVLQDRTATLPCRCAATTWDVSVKWTGCPLKADTCAAEIGVRKLHTSQVTRHTSHVTRHKSQVKRHTSNLLPPPRRTMMPIGSHEKHVPV